MKLSKAFVLVSLSISALAFASPDGITLRKKLSEGMETYHADVSIKMNMDLGGQEQETGITSKAKYSFKIAKPDDSGASAGAEMTSQVEKLEATGLMEMLMNQGNADDAAKKAVTVKGKMSDRGRFTPDKVAGDATSMLAGNSMMAMGPFVEFPDKAINVGDSWDQVIPKGPLTGKEDQKLTAKLVRQDTLDGKDVYVINVTGKLKTSIDTSTLPKPDGDATGTAALMANAKIIINGTSEISGDYFIDKVTGKTLKVTMKVTTKQNFEMPDMGDMKIDMTGVTTSTMTADKI